VFHTEPRVVDAGPGRGEVVGVGILIVAAAGVDGDLLVVSRAPQ